MKISKRRNFIVVEINLLIINLDIKIKTKDLIKDIEEKINYIFLKLIKSGYLFIFIIKHKKQFFQ